MPYIHSIIMSSSGHWSTKSRVHSFYSMSHGTWDEDLPVTFLMHVTSRQLISYACKGFFIYHICPKSRLAGSYNMIFCQCCPFTQNPPLPLLTKRILAFRQVHVLLYTDLKINENHETRAGTCTVIISRGYLRTFNSVEVVADGRREVKR